MPGRCSGPNAVRAVGDNLRPECTSGRCARRSRRGGESEAAAKQASRHRARVGGRSRLRRPRLPRQQAFDAAYRRTARFGHRAFELLRMEVLQPLSRDAPHWTVHAQHWHLQQWWCAQPQLYAASRQAEAGFALAQSGHDWKMVTVARAARLHAAQRRLHSFMIRRVASRA